MNYKVLYRKYRPTTFSDVVGQDNTIELIKDSIINDKVSHAYIFSGPRGTGKTSTAKILAKTINCLCAENGNPCEKCDNCLNFATSSDIYEIDAASNNGVDQIRELIDNIKLTPINSKYKVYIIDEVHMLSTSAFNALLLTLEEPPSHVVFILATTDIEDVPITVLSRCQRLDFKKINSKDIVKTLKKVCDEEKIEIDDAALEEIADYSDGGLRDALSILDQLSKNPEKITQELVLNSIGLISSKAVDELLQKIDLGDVVGVCEFVKNTKENAADFKTVCKKLINALKKRAIDIKLGKYAGRMSYEACKNLCFEVSSCIYKYNVNLDPFSILELILLDYCVKITKNISREIIQEEEEQKVSDVIFTEKVVETDKKDEENISREIFSSKNDSQILDKSSTKDDESIELKSEISKKGNIQELIAIRINNCFVNASKQYLNAVKEFWNKFIALSKSKKERGVLMDTVVVLASDTILVIKSELEAITDEINSDLLALEQAFNEYINGKYKIIAVSSSLWDNYMSEYKENLKKGVTYQMKDEPSVNEEIPEMFDDVFSKQKIEVK